MGKILCHNTDPQKIEPTSQITHFDAPSRRKFFEVDCRKTVIFDEIRAVCHLAD